MVISTLTFPLGMNLTNKYGSRPIVALGGLIACTSVAAAASIANPVVFFLFYAAGFGIGKGFLYPSPLKASWSHLPGRKGLVSGFIVSGLGLGAFIYGIVVNILVNPENLSPVKTEIKSGVYEYVFEKTVSDRVPKMLYILATVWCI